MVGTYRPDVCSISTILYLPSRQTFRLEKTSDLICSAILRHRCDQSIAPPEKHVQLKCWAFNQSTMRWIHSMKQNRKVVIQIFLQKLLLRFKLRFRKAQFGSCKGSGNHRNHNIRYIKYTVYFIYLGIILFGTL